MPQDRGLTPEEMGEGIVQETPGMREEDMAPRGRLPLNQLPGELNPKYKRNFSERLLDLGLQATEDAPTIGATIGSIAGVGAESIPLAFLGGMGGQMWKNYIQGRPIPENVVKEGGIQGGVEAVTHGLGAVGHSLFGPQKLYRRALMRGAEDAGERAAVGRVEKYGLERNVPVSKSGSSLAEGMANRSERNIANLEANATGGIELSPFDKALREKAAAQAGGSFPGKLPTQTEGLRSEFMRGTSPGKTSIPIQDALPRLAQDKEALALGKATMHGNEAAIRQQAVDFLTKQIEQQVPGLLENKNALAMQRELKSVMEKAVANGTIDPLQYVRIRLPIPGLSHGGMAIWLKPEGLSKILQKPEINSWLALRFKGVPGVKITTGLGRVGALEMKSRQREAQRKAEDKRYEDSFR